MRTVLTTVLVLGFLPAMAKPGLAAVTISSDPTTNMVCSDGVCSPTAKNAVLNVNDLANLLAASDAKVVTGNGAVTIQIVSPLTWGSATGLTLDANLNVSFKAPVTVAGTGAVTIVTNDGGSGGDLMFSSGGSLSFWDRSSSLKINGTTFELENSIAQLGQAIGKNNHGAYALAQNYDASQDSYDGGAIGTRWWRRI